MTDDYRYWREALAGNKPQMSEGSPEVGFYRWPKKASYGARKTFKSVNYWRDGDVIYCSIDDTDTTPQYGADIWISVGSHPVSYENYQGYMETGRWADEHPLVPMGSNQPPDDDSYEGLKAKIEERARDANKLLIDGAVATTQDEADQLSNLADELARLGQRAEEQRKAEKAPHDNAAAAVQAKWKPLVITSEVYKGIKNRLIAPFLSALAKQAREDNEEGIQFRAGTRGRAMSLRSTKSARIVDRDAVLAHFKDNEMISTSLQILADRAVRNGDTVPGCEIEETEKVV